MISVGIDVSKGKSTVCILKPYGEIVSKPFNITHTQKDLSELSSMLFRLNDEVKIVMEATGIYHLPVLTYLQEKGFFVSVINPYLMKSYRNESLRKAKTDISSAICCRSHTQSQSPASRIAFGIPYTVLLASSCAIT